MSTLTDVNDLCSNQEQADTKIVIHALHSLHHSQIPTINIHSPSGDTDILVLTIVHLYNYKEKILTFYLVLIIVHLYNYKEKIN